VVNFGIKLAAKKREYGASFTIQLDFSATPSDLAAYSATLDMAFAALLS